MHEDDFLSVTGTDISVDDLTGRVASLRLL